MSSSAIQSFLEDLEFSKGRSLNTLKAYRRDLEIYTEFLKSKGKNFYLFLEKKNLKPRSQARVISSVRSYFKFCEIRGFLLPKENLKPPRFSASLPQPLKISEFQKLMEICKDRDAPEKTARNEITLLLLFGCGLRVSELVSLDLTDYRQNEGCLVVMGKGNKQRLVPLTQALHERLYDYLKAREKLLIKSSLPALILNNRGSRPSRVDIWRWLEKWSKKAGLERVLSPHKFRHGCATELLEQGADLRSLQTLLGHASIQTTQIYTHVTTRKLREDIQRHHPLSRKKWKSSR